ncbi:ADP-ribosylglycohydrolase family protein [Geomonas propionica]|uniref:ADP-ribosylglycohydrolase family protein n=1 Tax=Geomonas propionica TaxID=2798582 RepID=A0ABS0YP14_9BACT|nr:ADP-ribosylglycohydrolase family protein [Geomonas propionica]MBJ6799725.1 ADP-ribosylglycohydrolase family protein [Geomonas propionica]
MIKTSESHPLQIGTLQLPYTDAKIGLTFCPGKKGPGLNSVRWERSLEKDLSTIISWGATALVTLVEDHEFGELQVPEFKEFIAASGLEWFHIPIVDGSIPDHRFHSAMQECHCRILELLCEGARIVIHCRGGLGRTGLFAAMLLIDFGIEPEKAIAQVRAARPGAIETSAQERYVHTYFSHNHRRNLNHYLGCLLGGAAGDALGAAVEFSSFAEIRQKYGATGIQCYDTAYGRTGAITDDTQMTLFTAEGLLRACCRANEKGIGPSFPSMVHQAYRRWLKTQQNLYHPVDGNGWLINCSELYSRRAPGGTCITALLDDRVRLRSDEVRHNTSKGCGAVMRAAPIGLFVQSPYLCRFWGAEQRNKEAFEIGQSTGYLTHGHPSGYLPAGFLALLIGRIIDGDNLDTALDACCKVLAGAPGADETLAAVSQARELAMEPGHVTGPEAVETLGDGWVGEEALAISIYCALIAKEDFTHGIQLAVNHGGDSDSTGAITGNILGALLGVNHISQQWLDELELREVLKKVAKDLFIGFSPRKQWWDSYPGF